VTLLLKTALLPASNKLVCSDKTLILGKKRPAELRLHAEARRV
jgi:hypothetical protein